MACFGIDFGTTNSSAFEINGPIRLHIGESGQPLRSLIAVNKATGQVLVGKGARGRQLELEAAGTWEVIPSIKRFLATDRAWTTNTRAWTPRDVAAAILQTLNKEAARLGIRGGIEKATFSIPVGLAPAARKVLRNAARDAGIDVAGFVSESTSVFFRYWDEMRHCRHVAVFDWGGGTLDISVLEVAGGVVHERSTVGLAQAGDDLDRAIALYLHGRLMRERGTSMAFEQVPTRDRDLLLTRAEIAKCALAEETAHFVAMAGYMGAPANIRITREELTPIVGPYVDGALDLLSESITRAGLSTDAIDNIVIVGGSSRLWLLRERLASDDRFAGRYGLADEPEWDVACGAAMLDEHPGSYRLGETLGLLLSDETYHELVCTGGVPQGRSEGLSLSLVEDARQANLIVDRWASATHRRNAVQFSVPALGFDREEIQLRYGITDDLVFEIEAASSARGTASRRLRECADLRFSYDLGGPR
jgi:molecular chaperone DnaK